MNVRNWLHFKHQTIFDCLLKIHCFSFCLWDLPYKFQFNNSGCQTHKQKSICLKRNKLYFRSLPHNIKWLLYAITTERQEYNIVYSRYGLMFFCLVLIETSKIAFYSECVYYVCCIRYVIVRTILFIFNALAREVFNGISNWLQRTVKLLSYSFWT